MVAMTLPLSSAPASGVFLPLEANSAGSTTHSRSGSKMVISAGAPTASVPSLPCRPPRIRAGAAVSLAMRVHQDSLPVCTSPIRLPSAVSRPLMPKGASANGRRLSASVCGAWSVAMTSMVPSLQPPG